MQLGILGLAKAGKTTLFNTLTASHETTDKFSTSDKTHVAVAKVPDPRLVALRDLFQPRRYVPATVEYVDIPGIARGDGPESLDLAKLKTVDALLHVVRAFEIRRSRTRTARSTPGATSARSTSSSSSPTTRWSSAGSIGWRSRASAGSRATSCARRSC